MARALTPQVKKFRATGAKRSTGRRRAEPRQDGAQLAQSKGCMICHAVDQTKMGPNFKDIAAKYAGHLAAIMHDVTRFPTCVERASGSSDRLIGMM